MVPPSPSQRIWLISCTLLYVVLAGTLAVGLWQAYGRPVFVEQPPGPSAPEADADRDPAASLVGQIDPNDAGVEDLALLPGIGRSVAERIVSHRHAARLAWQQTHPEEPPGNAPPVFRTAEDLLPVKGIGPKTLEKLRPHLRMPGTDIRGQRPGTSGEPNGSQ